MEIQMKKSGFLMFAVLFAIALSPVGVAHAKKNKDGDHPGQYGSKNYDNDHHDDDRITISIGSGDRVRIQNYLANDYRRNCPPGLAKKHNGCMPPGQAKKYRVGYPLPHDVVFFPVTGDLLDYLSPVPRGYRYVQVDKDVLLIGEASKKVIDAVTLLSAVGN